MSEQTERDVRTEWAVRIEGDLGKAPSPQILECETDHHLATIRLQAWQGRPGVSATLLSREVVTSRGQWKEASS